MEKQMTKERLSSYISNKQEIKELEYTLKNRWRDERLIGNNVIFDYNKGYPMPQSVVGFDHEKYGRLQDRDLKRKEELETECKAIEDFVEDIGDSIIRRIFRLHFIEGKKQRKVAMTVHLDQSSVSKKIDNYLKNA